MASVNCLITKTFRFHFPVSVCVTLQFDGRHGEVGATRSGGAGCIRHDLLHPVPDVDLDTDLSQVFTVRQSAATLLPNLSRGTARNNAVYRCSVG